MSYSIVNMNIQDIESIEFSVPVYLEQVGKWFRNMEITDTDGKRVSINLYSSNRGSVEPDYRLPLKPISQEVAND